MLNTLTRTTRAIGVVAASLGLAAMGLVLTSTGPASASATTPTLDHFLCYQARIAGPKAPAGTMLENLIQPVPFAPLFGAASTHCNPANKEVSTTIFRAKNPLAHLYCYQIAFKYHAVKVLLKNQFGQALMTTGASPTRFCLPSWKDNLGPPGVPTTQPPGLDHFTCYPLTEIVGAYAFHPPAGVKAEDEFSAPKYTTLKLANANLLCVPTTKILVTGKSYPPQSANDLSLVCFPSSPTPLWKVVYDENQFGSSTVYPNTTREAFCLPSTVSNQGPVG